MTVVGRLAPSPTGLLHLGHARSFLLAWWSVRSQGGRLVLRIEDLDAQRCQPRYVDACLRDLEWLGMDWDAGPRMQSAGIDRIRAEAERLAEAGLAYPCVCSRRDIQASQSAPHVGDREIPYPGTCRDRFPNLQEACRYSGTGACLRFRVPDREVTVVDALSGTHRFNLSSETGDFPILRRDQSPAYQLAVVVDDVHDGVTEVLRGDDLLPSAARQQALYDAFGVKPPRWIHVPLVVDQNGQRLAKRTDALSLAALREGGVSPHQVIVWVARSLGIETREIGNLHDVTPRFRVENISPEPICGFGRLIPLTSG